MKITLYLDEDSQDSDLVKALRLRDVDILTSSEAGMNGHADEQQLSFAASEGRAIYSFNSRDFFRWHGIFLMQDRSHAGIILCPQQQFSIGEQLRRLLRLIGAKSGEEMENQVEFLTSWGE